MVCMSAVRGIMRWGRGGGGGAPQCGGKIRKGSITLVVLGGHIYTKWLHNPCCLVGTMWGQNQKWLPHAGAQAGKMAT